MTDDIKLEKAMVKNALEYSRQGFSVFPVRAGNKKPLVAWAIYQKRHASEEEIRRWWTKWPNANIGLVTGSISGLIAIDIEKGGSVEGFPTTIASRTGGGGFHLFYKHPGFEIKNSVKNLAPLTDVRGDGGYVVAPPSLHASGVRYEWMVSPEDADFTELPEPILEKIRAASTTRIDWREFNSNPVLEGARHDSAVMYVGKLLHGLAPELWESTGWVGLKSWNERNCIPALNDKELRSIFEDIAKREASGRVISVINTDSKRQLYDSAIQNSKAEAVFTRLSDIAPQKVEWLWPDRIAHGKLSMISGDPGLGKSLLTAAIAAIVSRGYKWPLEDESATAGSVVLLSAEDDAADTIRPRLDAAGADCNRIHILEAVRVLDETGKLSERNFSLKRDLEKLEEKLAVLSDCRLIIIDPISAYLEDTDSHKNAEVRSVLAPLAKLAMKHRVAVILVQHLNKNSKESAMYRAVGSIAFVAAVRSSFVVTKDKENPSRRLVIPVKNNLAKEGTGLAYSVQNAENGAPVLVWESQPVEITADDALMPPKSKEEEKDNDWAVQVLEMVLAKSPLPAKEVYREMKSAGVTDKMTRTAREKLGVRTKKSGFESGWIWSLPANEGAQFSEDTQPRSEGTLGLEGHLGHSEVRSDTE